MNSLSLSLMWFSSSLQPESMHLSLEKFHAAMSFFATKWVWNWVLTHTGLTFGWKYWVNLNCWSFSIRATHWCLKLQLWRRFEAWLRTWVLWLSNSVLRSKNLRARVVWESAWFESNEVKQQSHGKWQYMCREEKNHIEVERSASHGGWHKKAWFLMWTVYLLGCDWKEGTGTRWAMSQWKTMEALVVSEISVFFFFLGLFWISVLICYNPLLTDQNK